MSKKVVVFLLTVLVMFGIVSPAYAVYPVETSLPVATSSPDSSLMVQNVNSFELFWPMVAGKTIESKLYPLKLFKEKIRGFFVFGAAQKADYKTKLATKRLLEVEQLLKDTKTDLAKETLNKMSSELNAGFDLWSSLKGQENVSTSSKQNIATQLDNLDKFLKYLSLKNTGDVKVKFDETTDKVHQFQYSLSL